MEAALELMKELTRWYPIYAVNGNHEQRLKEQTEKYGDAYDYYSQAVRSFGVHLLEKTSEYAELCRMPSDAGAMSFLWIIIAEGGASH